MESLLRLSEVGQYEQVKQLFSFPIKHCPDMLVLALLQISTSWHTLRHELISTLMPIFLGNHPNSAIILHYAWHGQVGVRACFVIIVFWGLAQSCFYSDLLVLYLGLLILFRLLTLVFYVVVMVCNWNSLYWLNLVVIFPGTVSFHPSANYALNGWVVYERWTVWPGQALSHLGCGTGLEGLWK